MSEIDVDAIPLDMPSGADAPATGLKRCRCIDCRHLVPLGDLGNGCEAIPVERDRDITRWIRCRPYKPKGPSA